MRLLKSLGKATLIVAIIFAAYVGGLLLHLVPQNLTPQVLFAPQYNDFKSQLAKEVAADPNASSAKSMLDSLNKMESSYKTDATPSASSVPAPKPAPNVPTISPAPGVPTPSPTPSATPGAQPSTQAAPAEQSAIDKAKASMQQYQNSIDQEKQQLEKL